MYKILTIAFYCILSSNCASHQRLTQKEIDFFRAVQMNIGIKSSVGGIPIYHFNGRDKKFIAHFEAYLYEYKGVKSDYYDLMAGKTIPFIEKIFGKPSKKGKDYLDYYLETNCTQSILNCNKIQFKIDTVTQKIIKLHFVSPVHYSH
jgi:hypothetical protein